MDDYDINNCQLFFIVWSAMNDLLCTKAFQYRQWTGVNKSNKLLKYQSKYWAQGSLYFQDVILRILSRVKIGLPFYKNSFKKINWEMNVESKDK